MEVGRSIFVSDLKQDLASLRLERDAERPQRARWPLVVLGLVLGAGGLFAGLQASRGLTVVEVQTVRADTLSSSARAAGAPILTASGYVVARRQAVVSAKIQGRLAQLRVEEGSRVRRGEVLARLESADFEALLAQARAQVQRAEADLMEQERQLRVARRLVGEEVLPADELEAAHSRVRIGEAVLAQGQAGLALAQARLDNTVILAPFSGVVVRKMAEVGESVAPIPPGVNISTASGAIVALADLATLEVEVDVAEANVAKLGPGQPAEVVVEAFPDRRYRAVLRQVIPTADRTRATVEVKVTILDKDDDLKPEMTAKVDFLATARPAVTGEPADPAVVSVPTDAIARRGGRSVVFEVEGEHVRLRAVQTGARRGDRTEVHGLAGGELLVARPPGTLKDGDRIRKQNS